MRFLLTHVNLLAFDHRLANILAADYKTRDSSGNLIPLEHTRDDLGHGDRTQRC